MPRIIVKQKLRVAVVEDDHSVRKALSRLLESFGMQVLAYPSGSDLLQALRDADPDCLVLDLHMPGLNGFQLQAHLKALGSNLPLVFISASATSSECEKALEAGGAAFLRKPFEGEDLHFAIAQATQAGGGDPGPERVVRTPGVPKAS